VNLFASYRPKIDGNSRENMLILSFLSCRPQKASSNLPLLRGWKKLQVFLCQPVAVAQPLGKIGNARHSAGRRVQAKRRNERWFRYPPTP
jgi:hypothetical protein